MPDPRLDDVTARLRQVFDPEIPVNVFDLGLIYQVNVAEEDVNIKMTFTSSECPSARAIPADIQQKVGQLDWVAHTNIDIVWDPPWHPRMISQEGKKELGIEEESPAE